MDRYLYETALKPVSCCKCSVLFAIPESLKKNLVDSGESFFCPAGHGQHYPTGKTAEQKLREELERKEQMLDATQQRALKAAEELKRVSRAHYRMRARVFNGVCPCCNRSFENLRRHMQSEHAELPANQRLKHLRTAFGMTQTDLSNELDVSQTIICRFETGASITPRFLNKICAWLDKHETVEEEKA